MSTLISIPNVKALHLPARGAAPVPLAEGDLVLTLLPAEPPVRAKDVLTLSVGSFTFMLAENSPVQRTQSKNEHPSFVFTPAPPEGGQSIGQVRLDMADSTSPEAWERTEEACKSLESELKAHKLWEDKELFVDDEYETDGPVTGPRVGWGESIASAVMGGASSLVGRLTGRTAEPGLPTTAPKTGVFTATSPTASHAPGHAAGVAGSSAPQSPTAPDTPADFKTMAADSWTQAGIAARGIGEAAYAVGGALGQQARSAVEGLREGHNAPAPPAKDAPAVPAKDAHATAATSPTSPVTHTPATSATAAALDAPAAASAPAAKEEAKEDTLNAEDDETKKETETTKA